jgi:hypothetical protein
MQLKTVDGLEVSIDEATIIAAAGRIYAGRRKRFGGPPRKMFECLWCGVRCEGRAGLEAHQGRCDQSLGSQMGLMPLASVG